MASSKLARKLFSVANRMPARRFIFNGRIDADSFKTMGASGQCQFLKVRSMASATEEQPANKGSQVAVRDEGALSSRGGRPSTLGLFDMFNAFPSMSLRGMIDHMDRIFDEPFFGRAGRNSLTSGYRPPWDFMESDDSFRIRVDVPGLTKEDVKVCIEDDCLVIKGEHKEESESDDNWASRSYGSYSTRILLPDNANAEQIKAELKHGVLSVTVPKVEEDAKKNVIDIQVED